MKKNLSSSTVTGTNNLCHSIIKSYHFTSASIGLLFKKISLTSVFWIIFQSFLFVMISSTRFRFNCLLSSLSWHHLKTKRILKASRHCYIYPRSYSTGVSRGGGQEEQQTRHPKRFLVDCSRGRKIDDNSSRVIVSYGATTNPTNVATGHSKYLEYGNDEDSVLPIDEHSYHNVYIAVGSNMGDRFDNLMTALSMLENTNVNDVSLAGNDTWSSSSISDYQEEEPLIRIVRTSFLRETEPMYVTNQPSFLNGAVEIQTKLLPHALLRRLKDIEKKIGRDLNHGIRFGPRPIDLDILYYGVGVVGDKGDGDRDDDVKIVKSSILEIPHPRIPERTFVLSPLMDLNKNVLHPINKMTPGEMLYELHSKKDDHDEECPAIQVLPLPRGRMLAFNQTHIMGILNVTPDSFSDGRGGHSEESVDESVQRALELVKDGATIIDIGGESTRPGAKEVEVDVELKRTIPVIKKLRQVSNVPISIDTRHSQVARAAIEAGADMVNDVSGGMFDPLMFASVAELRVPIIIMHMRGTPETMQSMTEYENVLSEVSKELMRQSRAAEECGIPRWMQVLDPGIGFAKDLEHNLSLLKHCGAFRTLVEDVPLLLGPSRKGFIGKITGETIAKERDFGTLAACLACLVDEKGTLAPTILRVHNVKGVAQGVRIMEAILNAK